jgi:hypothetical protein
MTKITKVFWGREKKVLVMKNLVKEYITYSEHLQLGYKPRLLGMVRLQGIINVQVRRSGGEGDD